ncbi:peptidoglycan D,D-transpeptidase FtsI family protein [Blautia sp. An81]|mgnify:FL=1|uniref:peptidoglycan D,D-transpeptidase FtsI family protein n=1 Tax=Blautia sp. An81 TaxID=1965659 RepID=UPI001FA86866|nr:penicillin-binding transpeptidase domain-containing protein [Blautia sp. An81]
MNKQESKKRKLTKKMKRKLAGVFGVTLLAFAGLLVGITVINAREGNRYARQVLSQSQQQYTNTTIPFRRGTITDRNGTVLANSVKVYNLILDCQAVNYNEDYREPTIAALEEYFNIDRETIEGLLDNEETSSSQYQILETEVSMDDKNAFEAANELPEDEEERAALSEEERTRRSNVQGIYFEDDYERVYPLEDLACDVIGFTDAGNTADWGLEGYYNSTLNGTNGRKFGYLSEDTDQAQTIVEAVDGKNLTTTLDATIQGIAEKYIEALNTALSAGPNNVEGEQKKGAENIGVIIEDPDTGEILAMASSGSYDLNNPRDLSGIYTEEKIEEMNDEETKNALFSMWNNFCITEDYEPGSVVKPIVVASALESGAVTENDTFYCDSGQQIGEDFVRCAVYPNAHGVETLGEVIQNSCNDGMMAIGRKMGAAEFLKYQSKFNFGTRTGIDLPGEGTGILFSEENMNEMELATSAFGQGFTCTMIQEISAMAAAINGGTYYQPHLVKSVTDQDGKVLENITPTVMKEPISEEVSAAVREYMGMSVESGTSQSAKVQGYSMGGKTGTAEKLADDTKDNYLVSFIGFAPLDDPEVLIYVVVDTPNVDSQASSTYAQYLAQAILSEVLPYMNIPQDEETTGETVLWQGFYGVPKFTDIVEDGVSNPYGTVLDQGYGDGDPQETELNDEYSDGITNEEAEIDENDPSYEEDVYDTEELENFGQEDDSGSSAAQE